MAGKEQEDDVVDEVAEGEEIELEAEGKEGGATPKTKQSTEAKEDSGVANRDADAEDDEEDVKRTALREQRRKEKQDRKLRRAKAIERDKVQLDYYERRNEELEKRVVQLEGATVTSKVENIDQQIAALRTQLQEVKFVHTRAIQAQNGEDASQAMELYNSVQEQIRKAEQTKESHKAQAQQRETQAQQRQNTPDPRVAQYANEFVKQNPWFNPRTAGEDTLIVNAIDISLVNEGFNPRTQEYWDELQERVEKRLPQHFDEDDEPEADADKTDKTKKKTNGGPKLPASGGSGRPTAASGKFFVSADRKRSLMEAGMWDDPVLRNKMLKKYQTWDKENKAS